MAEKRIDWKDLFDFVVRALSHLKVEKQDAEIVADNLVMSNLRGIDSHGVARLQRYVGGIEAGSIFPREKPIILKESSVLANVDGRNGLGQVAATFGMRLAIKKAEKEGIGMVTVTNSNHFGFAGYYPLMAIEKDLIGFTMTNSAPLVVPTFGKNAIIGTNPISVAAPANKNRPWVMDFATSVVPRGKLEVYNRLNKPLPEGWATDEAGRTTTDPGRVLNNLSDRLGGGILPLGGEGELFGGHKGYGLGAWVDIFCGILSGANFGPHVVAKKDGQAVPPRVGHMFMALDPDFFVGRDAFTKSMDEFIDNLKNSEKAEGESRIYVHGEKEYEEEDRRRTGGIPLDAKTVDSLSAIAEKFSEKIVFMD